MNTNKKWLVLSRNNIDNFIYKFSLFDGNETEVSKHLEEMKKEDILNSNQEVEFDEPNVYYPRPDLNKILCTYVEFIDNYIDYYAVPITSKFNWIITVYVGNINEYDFYFISTNYIEEIIDKMKKILSDKYQKYNNEKVPNPIINQKENNISIEMFIPHFGSIDIIAFPSIFIEKNQTFVFNND